MRSRVTETAQARTVEHEIVWKGRPQRLRATGALPATLPGPDSVERFFKEHELGYGRTRGGRPLTYRVEHPEWEVLRDPRVTLEWDFAHVYGPEWAFLGRATPFSVVVAVGSAVAVSPLSVP